MRDQIRKTFVAEAIGLQDMGEDHAFELGIEKRRSRGVLNLRADLLQVALRNVLNLLRQERIGLCQKLLGSLIPGTPFQLGLEALAQAMLGVEKAFGVEEREVPGAVRVAEQADGIGESTLTTALPTDDRDQTGVERH
jgi:hypothetical protein